MMGSGADPGPGPAPPPSLTLPPLRELDKGIRPDSSSSSSHRGSTGLGLMGGLGGQPRSQFTDPHLHQHSHSQQNMQQHHYQQQQQQQQQRGPTSHSFPQYPSSTSSSSSHGAGSQQYYPHDHHSRHSSSVGSLPDLYMSSSGAPSTVSRADSLSSIEYLHGSHPLHSHAHRHLSGSVSGSTTTGSTTGSSFGQSVASGSVSSGGSGSVYLHHSTSLGRANLNAAILHQRNPRDSAASSTTGSGDASSSAATNNGTHATNGKSGATASGSAGTEQGRNSTKRAAQNRAAQRAFRQRKDLYVRELERKAELLQQAEGKILRLTARNHELEVALAAKDPSSSSSLSPQQSPLHSHASPTTGLVCAAGTSSEQDQQQQQQQQQQQPNHTLHHNSSREQLDRGDRERGASGGEWNRGEKSSSISGRDQEFCDDNSSTHSGHSYPSSLGRATLGRRSASQPMRSAYNASTPPLTNDSLKFHSLKQQLAANQHLNQPHSLSRHSQQQQQHPSRTDSDYEFEGLDHPAPQRQLHRHPSEPSLNQSRRGSNSGDSGDDYATSGVQNHRQNTYPHDQNRGHRPRRSSVDSRMELTSPVFNNNQSASSSYHSSNNGVNAGSRLLPSEYTESSPPSSSVQTYTSNGNVQHERQPLYPITTQGGSRSAPLGSARSWGGAQQEDAIKPHSPRMASPVAGLSRGSVGGGMATSAASPTRGSGGYSRSNDMEHLSDERSEAGSGFDAMNKRSSDGAISWTGSNSSGGRGGGPPGPEAQSSLPLAYHNNASSRIDGLGLRKENSWSSFSTVSKGGNDGYNRGGGLSPVSLPPVSALAGVGARKMGDDMEMQDLRHDLPPTQHLQQQQQQRDGEGRPSGSDIGANYHRGSMAMMSDSPERGSSDTRFLNNNNNNSTTSTSSVTTPQISGRQQYFPSQPQQQHRANPFAPQQHHQNLYMNHHGGGNGAGHHPLSPANEYPPGSGGAASAGVSEMDGVFEQHKQQHHQSRYNNHPGGIAAGYHEETMMRSP